MPDEVVQSRNIIARFSLDGRVSLVTGGGQGIGRAFSHALGEAGSAVAVVDLLGKMAEEVAHELSNKGIDSIAITADVTDDRQIKKMIDTVYDHWGKLTIAVNNAGISDWVDAESQTRESWDKILKLNLDAVFFCAQAEARRMMLARYGKIINTASMSAHIVNSPQHQVAYNTSKAAVLHMSRSLAAEWAPHGVRVNSISPGYTCTKLVEDLLATPLGRSMKEKWLPMIPLGRIAEVTDLQGAIVYLASEVSDYMTGADLIIDGGYCTL